MYDFLISIFTLISIFFHSIPLQICFTKHWELKNHFFFLFFFIFFLRFREITFFYWSKHWQLFFIFNRSHVWFNIATIGNFLSTPLPLLPRPACTLLALCINSSKLNNFVLKPWFTTQKGKKQFVKKNEIENKVNVIV